MSMARQVVIAVFAGLLVGIAISSRGAGTLIGLTSFAEVMGSLWVNAIRMTVLPLVVSLLIVAIGSAADSGILGRLGGRTLLLFLAMLCASAIFAALLAPLLFVWFPSEHLAATALKLNPAAAAASITENTSKLPGFGQWLLALVPTNPARAAADGKMLPLLVFTILFALASTRISSELRLSLMHFFQAVSETMLMLVRWIIILAPIGVFALMLSLGARMGTTAIGAIGYGVAVFCAVVFLQLMALYPVTSFFGGVSVRRFAQAALPVQAIAASTRSSLATLPVLIESAGKRLGIPIPVGGFVLPLAVSTFKFTLPTYWILGTLFIGKLYGVSLGTGDIAMIAAVSIIMSFSVPGIPSGGVLLMAPLFPSMGLPLEGIGILIAMDVFPDMFKTMTNVTADLSVAVLMSRGEHALSAAAAAGNVRTETGHTGS